MRRYLNHFLRNTSGNVSIMAAFAAIPALAATGAAVDWMRLNDYRTEVYSALDGAVLAGTQAYFENDMDKAKAVAEAKRFYDNAIPAGQFTVNDVTFKLNSKGNGIAASGQVEVPTSFMKVVGIDKLVVLSSNIEEAAVAESGVNKPSADLEVSLMLDVTGSMCADNNGPCTSGPKISALKSAAADLVDTVIWDDQTSFTSKIAVVPFSTRVRVGPDGGGGAIMKKLTNLEPTWNGWYKMCTNGSGGGGSETDGGWTCNAYETKKYTGWKIMPCVTDRFYNDGWKFELTDADPAAGRWMNAHDGGRMPEGQDSSAIKATVGTGKTKADPATFWNYDYSGMCYDVAPANEVMPLTNDKAKLKSKISGLQAFGATGGVLGTAFSWYMLSPAWKNIWTGQSQPKPYEKLKETNADGKPKLRKVAILMTDGSYNTFRGWKGQDINLLSSNAKEMCANMKAKGIEIYTIGFALDELPPSEIPTSKSMLQSCATSPKHFYDSHSPDELKQAFKDIGQNVSDVAIRISR